MKAVIATLALTLSFAVSAQAKTCKDLPNHETVKKALIEARKQANGGFNLDMWATIVDRSGTVCSVVQTGDKWDSQ